MLLPSFESSCSDGSNEDHNICFYGKIRKIIPKLFLLPLLIWSTDDRRTFTNNVCLNQTVSLGLVSPGFALFTILPTNRDIKFA